MGQHATKGLTHEQRRDRRRQMAARVAAGIRPKQVAVEFGVTEGTVRLAITDDFAESDRSVAARRLKHMVAVGARAGLSDEVIAASLGRSRGTVAIYRAAAGIKRTRPAADWESADWTKNDSSLARVLGVSRQRVQQKRKRLGKPASPFRYHPLSA